MKTPAPKTESAANKQTDAQKQAPVDGILQAYKSTAIQRQAAAADEPVQAKSENRTGLPDNLKAGVESLSGYSMDDVKVHYNSAQPATLQAHAYAQGTDIHIAPGQEQHLPHEAWHVAQQKQGRVQPTKQLKGKVNLNDDAGLEKEADVMGAKALQLKTTGNVTPLRTASISSQYTQAQAAVQRKIMLKDGSLESKFDGANLKKVKNFIMAAFKEVPNTKIRAKLFTDYGVSSKEFKDELDKGFDSENHVLTVDELSTEPKLLDAKKAKEIKLLYPATFLAGLIENLGPDPAKYEIKAPVSGEIGVQRLNSEYGFKYIPENTGKKSPGYVANIASYYGESGVKNITKRYFDEAVSGSDDAKANKLAVVVGLNSFSPIVRDDYDKRRGAVETAVKNLEKPGYPVNFRGFGFLWEPNWQHTELKHVEAGKLRMGLQLANNYGNRIEQFKKIEKTFSAHLPYGVFRETVMGSDHTQDMVEQMSAYNNPVYIHSGDGDAISLKVTNDDDTGVSGKGVLDKFDEHLTEKGTGAQLVIGGYNLYNANEEMILTEIVKADGQFAGKTYQDGKQIDVAKPSKVLTDYTLEHQGFLKKKIAQIVHNSQVGNRYDRIIREAISTVYPKMLYPTEPNMLIKAKDTVDDTDLFDTSLFDKDKKLKKQGSMWGMAASEGRVFKENLGREYNEAPDSTGEGFMEWAKGTSLPTDPRGFARNLLVSGYEKYQDSEADFPAIHEDQKGKGKEGTSVPLTEAAVQQAQSYTSAFRLSELYAQAAVDVAKSHKDYRTKLDTIRKDARPAFNTVETTVKEMMENSITLIKLEQAVAGAASATMPEKITKSILTELLAKYKFYNGLK